MDGWVWKQDWRDWPTAFPPPAPPPKEPPPRAPWFRAPSIGLPKTVGMWMVWIVALCCCGALTGVACTMLADKFLGNDDPYYTGDDEGAAGGGSGGVAGQHKRRRPRRGCATTRCACTGRGAYVSPSPCPGDAFTACEQEASACRGVAPH